MRERDREIAKAYMRKTEAMLDLIWFVGANNPRRNHWDLGQALRDWHSSQRPETDSGPSPVTRG